MKNIYKKLVFLGLALICFLSIHGSASAQLLNLSSDNSNLQVGQSAVITATSGSGSGSVFFKQTPATGGRFDPTICTTTGGIMSTSCSVRFYPTSAGTYTISGTLTINGTTTQSLSSTNPRIKVTANTSTTPTLIGELVDSTPPTIFQGDQVELKITASPIPSGGPTVFISSPTLGNIGTCVINTTAGGICTSGFGPIRLNTGIEGTHDVNFSTTSWPNYTGTVSGTIKMTVQKTVTNPPVLDVCFPPKIKTSTGACVDPSTIDTGYTYLAPLSEDKSFNPAQENALSKYINIIVKIAIGIAAVLAVIMIVMGGIQYMTSELISSKEEGKKRITNAILGLLIALGAYLILFTINPNLLKLDVEIDPTTVEFEESESSIPFIPISSSNLSSSGGISCPESGGASRLASLAQTFIGHTTYSQLKKNKTDASIPTAYLDCSSFVAQVYKCAGLPTIFSGGCTSTHCIFAPGSPRLYEVAKIDKSGSKVTVNDNYELRPGDLLGWRAADWNTSFGHVVMYIGNGQFIDSRGPSVEKAGSRIINKAIHVSSSTYSKIKWLKKAPY